jgi:transposase InsO family protein
MGRRGVPYDNAKAESFMKTIKTEEVYLGGYETFTDVIHAGHRDREGADLWGQAKSLVLAGPFSFRTSSTRSTTNVGSTPRSDIGALSSLRFKVGTRGC